MARYIGMVALDDEINDVLQVRNTSTGVPVTPDSAPSYRIYGDEGSPIAVGTMSAKDTGAITGATNASPIVITSAGHNLQDGMKVTIASVGGNTAANGTWTVASASANTFALTGSTGNGAYTSGGTWTVTGLYDFSYSPEAGNGFDSGRSYCGLYVWTVSTVVQCEEFSFTVT